MMKKTEGRKSRWTVRIPSTTLYSVSARYTKMHVPVTSEQGPFFSPSFPSLGQCYGSKQPGFSILKPINSRNFFPKI